MTVHVQPVVRPEACPALVLNADYRPLSYYPLSLWSWQDAIKAVFLDRVNIVSEYDKSCEVRPSRFASPRSSPSRPTSSRPGIPPLPASTSSCATASPANIAETAKTSPSITSCPARRAARPPGTTSSPPARRATSGRATSCPARWTCGPGRAPCPTVHDLHSNGRLFPPNYLHDSWMDYLYWDSELEP